MVVAEPAPLLASDREAAAYVPVASPVKLSTGVVVDVAGADRPRRGQGPSLGGGAALEPPTDHRRVIGAGDRDGDVLGGEVALIVGVTVTVKVLGKAVIGTTGSGC